MKRPKPSETAKSVDKLPIKSRESVARWGAALSVAVVALSYLALVLFVRGCVHK